MREFIRNSSEWYAWILAFFIWIIIYFIGKAIKNRYKNDAILNTYFLPGLMLKVFGAISFAFYHLYVYSGGDTFGFYFTGVDISNYLFSSPVKFFQMVFLPFNSYDWKLDDLYWFWSDGIMWHNPANFIIARFGAVLTFFGFKTYVSTCIMFSMLSYVGIWQGFRTFCKIFPDNTKEIAIAFLFFPTVIFWGSGCGKDSICLGAICGFTACAFNVFVFHRKIIFSILLMLILGNILIITKDYILYAFLPPLLFALLFQRVAHIKSAGLKYGIGIFFMAIFIAGAYFGLNYIMSKFAETLGSNLAEFVSTMSSKMNPAGSTYDLGIKPENVSSLVDLVIYFPRAIVAAWFRPWIWESHNISMLLSALEGMFVIFLFSRFLIRGKFFGGFKIIIRSPLLIASFIYALLFCGLVALSTGNFGTLVRYKLPAMPYLISTLFIVNNQLLKNKKLRKP